MEAEKEEENVSVEEEPEVAEEGGGPVVDAAGAEDGAPSAEVRTLFS